MDSSNLPCARLLDKRCRVILKRDGKEIIYLGTLVRIRGVNGGNRILLEGVTVIGHKGSRRLPTSVLLVTASDIIEPV